MNHSIHGIITALALGLASAAAVAADVAPSAPPPATASAQAASVTKPDVTSSKPASSSTNVAITNTSSPPADGVRKMFCLNMSMRCFAMNQAATSNGKPAAPGSLDLRAPDIRTLVPEVRLREPLENPDEMQEQQEQVQVQGTRTRPEVEVPDGLMTFPWAVMHPTQAWRIFLPVPSAK